MDGETEVRFWGNCSCSCLLTSANLCYLHCSRISCISDHNWRALLLIVFPLLDSSVPGWLPLIPNSMDLSQIKPFWKEWVFKTVLLLCFLLHPWLHSLCHLSSALPLILPYTKLIQGLSPPEIVSYIVGLWLPGAGTTMWFTMKSESSYWSKGTVGGDGKGEQEYTFHELLLVWFYTTNTIPENSESAWMENLHLCP